MSVTRHGASRSQFFSAREVVRLYVVDGASDDEACDRKGRKFAYELVTSSKTLRTRFFETWNAGSRKAGKREATGRGAGKMNASLCAGARGQQGAAADGHQMWNSRVRVETGLWGMHCVRVQENGVNRLDQKTGQQADSKSCD